jgi:hypothetical protein
MKRWWALFLLLLVLVIVVFGGVYWSETARAKKAERERVDANRRSQERGRQIYRYSAGILETRDVAVEEETRSKYDPIWRSVGNAKTATIAVLRKPYPTISEMIEAIGAPDYHRGEFYFWEDIPAWQEEELRYPEYRDLLREPPSDEFPEKVLQPFMYLEVQFDKDGRAKQVWSRGFTNNQCTVERVGRDTSDWSCQR